MRLPILVLVLSLSSLAVADNTASKKPPATKPVAPKAPAITAEDDWECAVAQKSRVLKFGGDEWEFKATLKNRGKDKTSGKALKVKITAIVGSTTLSSSSTEIKPGQINAGSTYDYEFKVKPPAKGDAKAVHIVFDAGDGVVAKKEFAITAK